MREWFTRDSGVWWVLLAAAVLAHLTAVGVPPWQWEYRQWLELLTVVAAWFVGKQQTSARPHSVYGRAKATPEDYGR